MHIRSRGLLRNRRRTIGLTVGLLVPLGVLVPVGPLSTASAATRHPAGTQSSTVQLVQAYLSVLGPAGNKLSKVEAALKALGPSATRAQVLAAVAPLGPALAPVEALLNAPTPTTLEALPKPVTGDEDSSIRSTLDGAHLDVGGRLYPHGFQVSFLEIVEYSWQLHARYTTLSAQVGMDARYSGQGGVRMYVEDSTNTEIPFTYKGKLVMNAVIPTSGLVPVTVNVAHESEVQLEFGGGLPRLSEGVVDVVNDQLT